MKYLQRLQKAKESNKISYTYKIYTLYYYF